MFEKLRQEYQVHIEQQDTWFVSAPNFLQPCSDHLFQTLKLYKIKITLTGEIEHRYTIHTKSEGHLSDSIEKVSQQHITLPLKDGEGDLNYSSFKDEQQKLKLKAGLQRNKVYQTAIQAHSRRPEIQAWEHQISDLKRDLAAHERSHTVYTTYCTNPTQEKALQHKITQLKKAQLEAMAQKKDTAIRQLKTERQALEQELKRLYTTTSSSLYHYKDYGRINALRSEINRLREDINRTKPTTSIVSETFTLSRISFKLSCSPKSFLNRIPDDSITAKQVKLKNAKSLALTIVGIAIILFSILYLYNMSISYAFYHFLDPEAAYFFCTALALVASITTVFIATKIHSRNLQESTQLLTQEAKPYAEQELKRAIEAIQPPPYPYEEQQPSDPPASEFSLWGQQPEPSAPPAYEFSPWNQQPEPSAPPAPGLTSWTQHYG